MREHQIIITLKPDQFLEVQRMSRAANAKSMGIFVRQQLLAALGIEGEAGQANSGKTKDKQELQPVIDQIQRLHDELKGFVAESLSAYSLSLVDDMQKNLDSFEKLANNQTVQMEMKAAVSPDSAAGLKDNLETIAERTFAISPRLGPISDPEDVPPTPARERPQSNLEEPVSETVRPEIHRRHHTPLLNETIEVARPTMDPPKADHPVTMEDPLSKLLPQDADSDVPLSIAERRKQLEAADDAAESVAEEVQSGGKIDESAQIRSQTETQEIALPKSNDKQNLKPGAGQRPGSSSLSGSPPPKRRQV